MLPAASAFSFDLASQVVLALESVVLSIQKFLHESINESAKGIHVGLTKEHLQHLRNRLGTSAQKLLLQKHNYLTGNSLKIKVKRILILSGRAFAFISLKKGIDTLGK